MSTDRQLETKAVENLKVWDGFEFVDVKTIQRYTPGDEMVRIKTSDGQFLDCKRTHPSWVKNTPEDKEELILPADEILGKYVLTTNGYQEVVDVETIEYEGLAYDMTTASRAYVANNVRTHNSFHCIFGKSIVFNRFLGNISAISLEDLFELGGNIYVDGGKEYRNLEGHEIWDGSWVKLNRICRHKPSAPMLAFSNGHQISICQDNHPIATFENVNSCPHCGYHVLAKLSKRDAEIRKGKLRCTKCWKETDAKEIQPSSIKFEKLKNIAPNSRCLKHDYSVLTEVTEEITPKHDPYLVGMFISEGNCTFYKEKPKFIQIHQNPGPIHDKIRNKIESLGYTYSYRHKKGCGGKTFSIQDRALAQEFHVAYNRYSYNKALPKDFLSYSKEWLTEFLCAFIEGDGCISRKKSGPDQIILDTVSFELAQQLFLICMKFGIVATMLTTPNRAKTVHQGFRVSLNVTAEIKELLKNCYKIATLTRPTMRVNLISLVGYKVLSYTKPVIYTSPYVYDVTTESGMVVISGLLQHNSGGVAASRGGGSVDKFTRLEQLLNIPKTLPGQATLAKSEGTVLKIEKDPSTNGHNVFIKGPTGIHEHYVSHYHDVLPQVGTQISKGDAISTGPVNPHQLLKLKGMEAVKEYLTNELSGIYKEVGGTRRRNVEVVVRNLTNLTEIRDPANSEHMVGDVVPISMVEHYNATTKGDKIIHSPVIRGVGEAARIKDNDWMTRLNFQHIQKTIMEGASKGWKTTTKGSVSPVAPYATGNIGQLHPKITGKPEY
jgi:DNA-directed RNA polymerase subunit RPC12/RpoP